MSIDVDKYWASVPPADDEEKFTAVRGKSGFRTSRRTIFKSVGVMGGAFALNLVGTLPGGTKKAYASVGTEHTNCAGYSNWDGYHNNTKVCVGGTYSRDYCGADGWFLRYSGTCFNSGPAVACGEGVTKRNAWRWPHSGRTYRCADGYQQSCGSSSVFRICSWAL